MILLLPGSAWRRLNADAPFQDVRSARFAHQGRRRALGAWIPRGSACLMSVGGHLAGMMMVRGGHDFYPPQDEAADRLSAVPVAFAG